MACWWFFKTIFAPTKAFFLAICEILLLRCGDESDEVEKLPRLAEQWGARANNKQFGVEWSRARPIVKDASCSHHHHHRAKRLARHRVHFPPRTKRKSWWLHSGGAQSTFFSPSCHFFAHTAGRHQKNETILSPAAKGTRTGRQLKWSCWKILPKHRRSTLCSRYIYSVTSYVVLPRQYVLIRKPRSDVGAHLV